MCRCTARNFGPIFRKFTGLERFKPGFPAIIGNFAVEIAHIREGLSSEQFCVLRADIIGTSSWPGLSRLRGRSRFGEAKARPATPCHWRKNVDARDKRGHDDDARGTRLRDAMSLAC